MAKFIDLSSRLVDAKPGIMVAPGETYEVNDDKNNIILMNAEINKAKTELEGMETALKMLLGEPALADIEAKHPGLTNHLGTIKQLFIGALAAASGETAEECEKRFHPTPAKK